MVESREAEEGHAIVIKSKGSGEALDVIRDSHGLGLSAPPTLNGLKPLAFGFRLDWAQSAGLILVKGGRLGKYLGNVSD